MFEYDCSLLPARLICANRIPLHPLCGRGKSSPREDEGRNAAEICILFIAVRMDELDACSGLSSILRTRPVLFVVNYGVIK
ncbi:hypothetical protein CDAR_166391 [Caerostris darwini]|uniref:Uncharacterized protein n=1 Tax=Caerostris darwini TaxID=1538125 RepID=A0AAV4VUP2_9ARAC|nr:hypothetical protein CDAR_166391 [Caerostris darwini]